MESYRVRYSNGREVRGIESYDAAQAEVRSNYPDAAIGHDGDLSERSGERTLCWASEEESVNDDGARAVASIYREEL